MAKVIYRTIIIFILGFVILFGLRLAYGYWKYPDGRTHTTLGMYNAFSGGGVSFGSVKNYASKKRVNKVNQQVSVDQKYEKIANVGLHTNKFEKDEKRVRDLIKEKSALIQFEERHGLKGNRILRLAAGVNPEHFDGFVDEVQTFGKLVELTVNKSDKTNEYRMLKAERVSLEKSRDALVALKQREGKIQAMIELEQQILALEGKLQAMGVKLGDFDTENEFVTVKLSLSESRKSVVTVGLAERVYKAFVWTTKYYALVWLGLFVALLAAFIMTLFARLLIKMVGTDEVEVK